MHVWWCPRASVKQLWPKGLWLHYTTEPWQLHIGESFVSWALLYAWQDALKGLPVHFSLPGLSGQLHECVYIVLIMLCRASRGCNALALQCKLLSTITTWETWLPC